MKQRAVRTSFIIFTTVSLVASLVISAIGIHSPIALAATGQKQSAPVAGGEVEEYTVQEGDTVDSIAEQFGVSAEEILALNELEDAATLAAGEVLQIPVEDEGPSSSEVIAEAESQEVESEEDGTGMVDAEEAAAVSEGATEEYEIEEGDSLLSISQRYDTDIATLRSLNDLSEDILYKGQTLLVPAKSQAQSAPAPAMDMSAGGSGTPYEVDEGDSLLNIAREFGVSVEEIAAANGLETMILVKGQTLVIPGSSAEADGMMAEEEPADEAAPEEEVSEPMAEEDAEETSEEPATEESADAEESEGQDAEAEETMDEEGAEGSEEGVTSEEAATEEMEDETEAESTEAEESATEDEERDIVDTAIVNEDFSTLVAALSAAELVETLQGEGPFTVFAPPDSAFAALPEGTVDALLEDPAGDLTQILLYHVVQGEIRAADIFDGLEAVTVQGGILFFAVDDNGVTVNGVPVVATDIETTNGIIHVIDGVLLPASDGASTDTPETASETVSEDESDEVTESETISIPKVIKDGETPSESSEAAEDSTGSVDENKSGMDAAGDESARMAVAEIWNTPEGSVQVFSPVEGGAYHSEVAVTGLSKTYGGNLTIHIADEDGEVLARRTAVGGDMDGFDFFDTYLRFTVDEPTEAMVKVREVNVVDGTLMEEVVVPVILLPGQRFVQVDVPAAGDVYCETISVAGYSNTFEANVVLELRAQDGMILEQTNTMGGSMGVYQDFMAELSPDFDSPNALLLAAYEVDASGRYDSVDQTVVPITFFPTDSPVCS